MPRGPRQKLNRRQLIEVIGLKRGLVSKVADALQCSPTTIYEYIRRYPEIAQALEDARERMIDTAEDKLAEANEAGESWAVQFTLKTLGKTRGYQEKQTIEHVGKDDGPIQFIMPPAPVVSDEPTG